MRRLSFATLTLLLMTGGSVSADPFECNGQYIETGVGTTKEQVRAQCGPPSSEGPNRWYFMNQAGGVTVILYFVNDELQSIRHVLHQ